MDRRPDDPLRWKDFNTHRRPGLITLAWRWRTEIVLIVALVGLEYVLAQVIALISAIVVTVAAAELLYAVPTTRRWMFRRGRCLFTRHRLYSVFRETRTTTLKGRIPLIMRVSPTDRGDCAVVLCRAGISVEQLQKIKMEIRDACMANDVYFQPANAPFARIEIIRGDSKSQDKPWIFSRRRPSNGA
jgi:hypothetical protein